MNRRDAIQALLSLPAVTSIARARIAPDDVIVLEIPGRITLAHADRLRAQVAAIWGDRQRVIVLTEGMTLRIVRAADAPPGADIS